MERKEIVVQKYGGSSIATLRKMTRVAKHIRETAKDKSVVVVVSAMGKETDLLNQLAQRICGGSPPREELDKLLVTGEERSAPIIAMAIDPLGKAATSLTSREIGIETDSKGMVKRIRNIDALKELLEQRIIPVVTGFQGVEEKTNKITTLGHGGSDLTAIAIAGTLGLDYCEIYTDVPGIGAIDPRLVPNARILDAIPYNQMIELAEAGAGVLMDRSIELAQNLGVEVRVLLSPSFGKITVGTLVCSGSTLEEMERSISIQPGVAIQKSIVVNISGVLNKPGMAKIIDEALSDISLLNSIQGLGKGTIDITLFCLSEDYSRVIERLNKVKESGKVGEIEIAEGLKMAELTLVYPLMKGMPGYLARVSGAMGRADINIEMSSAPGTVISVVVKEEDLEKAAKALAEEFNLLY